MIKNADRMLLESLITKYGKNNISKMINEMKYDNHRFAFDLDEMIYVPKAYDVGSGDYYIKYRGHDSDSFKALYYNDIDKRVKYYLDRFTYPEDIISAIDEEGDNWYIVCDKMYKENVMWFLENDLIDVNK